jgi:hypothetical protein
MELVQPKTWPEMNTAIQNCIANSKIPTKTPLQAHSETTALLKLNMS